MTAIEVLQDRGFKANSDLPYCTANGTEYYVGINEQVKNNAAIVALINNEEHYLLDKADLREMSETATTYGIKRVTLYTNYGIEIHSKFESANIVGLDRIIKIDSEGFNHK